MKATIYSDNLYDYINNNKDYIKQSLIDNDFNENEITDNDIEKEAITLLDFESNDLKQALACYDSKHKRILCVGSLGLWNGRFNGGFIADNLSKAIYKCVEEDNELYYERKNSTLCMSASHHDGVNYMRFYELTDKGERFIENHYDLDKKTLHEKLRKSGRTKKVDFEIIL